MKKSYAIALAIIFAITLFTSILNTILLLERKHEHQAMVTVYTPRNIYYLTGREISDENGAMGMGYEFTTRNHAIAWLEQQTADDCNAQMNE